MRNELIELYQLACANANDKDIVRAYQRARDRIGPQIAVHEAMDADALRARAARLEEVLDKVHRWLVCAPIATAEDMAQSFPMMEEEIRHALEAVDETGIHR